MSASAGEPRRHSRGPGHVAGGEVLGRLHPEDVEDPPAPAAPAPTNAAPPVVTKSSTPTGSKVKWVRIRVRAGDTVRKIAKRRGHPEDAAAIVKRNKSLKGKRKLRSSRTQLLRHGRGATKVTRRTDRLTLWVPAR